MNYAYRFNGKSRHCQQCKDIGEAMAMRDSAVPAPAASPTVSDQALLDLVTAKPYRARKTVTFDIDIRIWDALEDRAESLGMSRNKYIASVLMDAVNSEPTLVIEEPCTSCKYAGTHPEALHCGVPRREIERAPDAEWNRSCPPGRERIKVRVCACLVCSPPCSPASSPPLQKS